jgi:GH25 family lysozyme M1 (1,4-beta-N-acetylmuramidase)
MANYNDGKPLGIDVSKYQLRVDWDTVRAQGTKFAGIRSGISWGYTDPEFARNWAEARRVGIARTAYHVLFPGEAPARQVEHWLKIVGRDRGELPLSLDIELDHGYGPDVIRSAVKRASDLVLAADGRRPMLYSAAYWIDTYLTGLGRTPPGWLNEHWWWLAQYLRTRDEHPGPVRMPRGVTRERVLIHQTTGSGIPFGVGSLELDLDRWQFDLAHLRAFAGMDEGPGEPPSGKEYATVIAQGLRLREGAGVSAETAGVMNVGAQVELVDTVLADGITWGQFDGWMAIDPQYCDVREE